tara:strand:- start:1521 stop:2825 length:1305 start_codon:yes stop_codon:yes gene_type:complete
MKVYKKRKNCRLCYSPDLIKILSLPSVAPGEQLRSNFKTIFYEVPIDLYQCKSCFHVQLVNIPRDNLMWNDEYTFMPSKNIEIIKHFKNVIDKFHRHHCKKIEKVFEIGSNDGLFLKLLKKKFNCQVLGIDPSKLPRQEALKNNIETIPKFFNYKYSKKIKSSRGVFDLIVANNVFAHTDNLNDTMKGITSLLKNDGYFVFEASYLLDVLQKKLIGTIIHEHLSVHSLTSFKPFLRKFNIHLIDVMHQKNIQGGAIIGIAKKNDSNPKKLKISKNLKFMFHKEKKYGLANSKGLRNYQNNFYLTLNKFKKNINKFLLKNPDTKLFCYGAARSIQITLKLLGIENNVNFILENNKFKFNKFIPLNNKIKIINEKKHKYSDKNLYLITAWVHTNTIIKNIKSKIKIKSVLNVATIYPKFDILNVKKYEKNFTSWSR